MERCREIWEQRYPSEPFENGFDLDTENLSNTNEDLLGQVAKQRYLYTKFNEPFKSEIVYLIAARQRYKGFLHSMNRVSERCSQLVPTSDILLMLLTHQVGEFFIFIACYCFFYHIVKSGWFPGKDNEGTFDI